MPVSSTQISSLVGGQTAMFHNQAIAAQQVSQAYGMGQFGGAPSQPMPNPYPSEPLGPTYARPSWDYRTDIGARTAGAMGNALPAAATMTAIGGAFAGGKLAMLDPFMGVASAFRAGTGAAAGAGVQGTLSGIGSAFGRGAGAGMRVLGGGLAAGAAAAVPYMLAGKAISTVSENIYAGAQDVQQVGHMAQQYMDPVFGQAGARRGGQRGRGHIRNMVSVLQEVASEDVMQDMDSLKKLMDQAGRSGMLQGIQDVTQFRDRFRGIVKKTKAIAQALGTSLQEAMPLMQQMGKMGLWTSQDIMGTTMAARASGPGATENMLSTMQAGAQQSHALGGTMRAGSIMGRDLFRTMQSAVRSGAMSRQEMFEFTGGATGARGQEIASRKIMGAMQNFGQSAMGQLMLAGLGETEEDDEGRRVFTGRIDEGRLAQFRRGEISVGQLQRMGRRVTQGSREAATSFQNQRERLGQSMLAQGGVEGVNEAIQRVMEHAFPNAGENVRKALSKQMLGVSSQMVEMLSKLGDEAERIKDFQETETQNTLRDSLGQLNERRFRSMDAISDLIGHSYDEAMKPIREFGSDLTTSIGETADSVVNWFFGRTREISMTNKERLRHFKDVMKQKEVRALEESKGAGAPSTGAGQPAWNMVGETTPDPDAIRAITPAEAGAEAVGQDWLMPGGTEGVTSRGQILGGFFGGVIPQLAGSMQGSRTEAIRALGIKPLRERLEGGLSPEGLTPEFGRVRTVEDRGDVGAGEVAGINPLGEGYNVYSLEEVQEGMQRAYRRATSGGTLRSLLGGEADTKENRERVTTIQKALRGLQFDQDKTRKLRGLRERNDVDAYNTTLINMLMESPEVREAFSGLTGDDIPEDSQIVRDVLTVAAKSGKGVSGFVLDERKALEALGRLETKEPQKEQKDSVDRMMKALSGEGLGERRISPKSGMETRGDIEGAGLARDELEGLMSEYGEDAVKLAQAFKSGNVDYEELTGQGNRILELATQQNADPRARKLMEYFQRAGSEGAGAFLGKVGKDAGGALEFVGLRRFQATRESLEGIQKLAQSQGALDKRLSDKAKTGLLSVRETLSSATTAGEYEDAMAQIEELAGEGGVSSSDIGLLSKGLGGSFGRMVGATARLGDLKAGKASTFARQMKGISSALGVKDISRYMDEPQREYLQQAFSDDQIDEEERSNIVSSFKEVIKLSMGATGRDKEAVNKSLMSELKTYTTANGAFVQVVGDALSKMSGLDTDVVQESLSRMANTNLKTGEPLE